MEYIEKISSPKTLWHCINSEQPLEAKPLSAILSILKNKVEQKDTKEDWGDSLYLAEVPAVSIGYADDDKGSKIPYLVKLELVSNLPCVFSTNKVYMGGEHRDNVPKVPTESIETEVERLFSLPIYDMPFMKYLGKNQHAYFCFHDENRNRELIVPSSMVSEENFKVKRVYKLNKNRDSGCYETPIMN